MKTAKLSERTRDRLLHIEAPGCIVNVRLVTNAEGRECTAIEILADGNRYSGDPEWWIDDQRGNNALNVRVVKNSA